MLSQPRSRLHWGLAIAGLLVVAYCLTLLVVVATAPDLRLRWLLVEGASDNAALIHGLPIRQTDGVIAIGPSPQPGDRLISISGLPVTASLDASRRVLTEVPPPGGILNWSASSSLAAPHRVDIEFWSHRDRTIYQTQLAVQAVPAFEIGLTLVWFLLQLGILGLGALAFWKRPFDRPARLFFAMCIVTLGAFVGGYHWWILSGSFWLSLPFVLCALLVPSVSLHFFLAYPQSKSIISRWHSATLWGLYGPPVAAAVGFVAVEGVIWQYLSGSPDDESMARALYWLGWLRVGIYVYLGIAATYFLATLASLLHSVLNTRPLLERRQVTSILWAGLIASLFIGYTLVLACWDRVAFALGGARVPMFLSSLVFMVAYAVGIVRYKLMLSEETFGRGFLLDVTRLAGSIVLGVVTVPLALQVGRHTAGLPWMPAIAVGVVLLVVTVLALHARDVGQRWMERRVFRERFRLEKALQRIHRAVGQLADPQFLSGRTLAACCDVLQAEWTALYLRDRQSEGLFRLSGVEGVIVELPLTWTAPEGFVRALESVGGIVSTYGERHTETSVLVAGLAQLHGDVLHLLEVDGETAGLVLLGPKQAGGAYSSEDGTFLTALTQLTGVALHCVRVHQDLTQLNEQLRMKVERIAQQKQQILLLRAELAATRPAATIPDEAEFRRDAIKGTSPSMARVLDTARKAAASDASVLIRGESGTGKELLARAIHENSPRRNGPLVAVHCAALAPSLLESELFGHVKGAFTGAAADRLGRIQSAQGGTLFLDEIGEISPETQVKLLRVLQQREIEPVGAGTPISVDVRLVAATHRNLEQMIADGRFREDLYYRINVITLTLPPLRERREDLHELAAEFLRRAAEKCDKRVVDFEEGALDALLHYDWPGNIRELENVIERAVVLSDGELITLADLPGDIPTAPASAGAGRRTARRPQATAQRRGPGLDTDRQTTSWRRLDGEAERRLLIEALEKSEGNKAHAAKLLGLPRSTFFSKLKKHSLAD